MAATIEDAMAVAGFPTARPTPTPPPETGRELDPGLRHRLEAGLASGDAIEDLRWVSAHAIERFLERFEPEREFWGAKWILYARLERGRYQPRRPQWLGHPGGQPAHELVNHGVIVLDGEMALPVCLRDQVPKDEPQMLAVVTCLYGPRTIRASAPDRRRTPADLRVCEPSNPRRRANA